MSHTGLLITLPEDEARNLLATVPDPSGASGLSDGIFPEAFDIYKSAGFIQMTKRLEYSMEIGESWSGSTPFINETDLEESLHTILMESGLDGFVIVTWDAFPVLETSRDGTGCKDTLPAVGILMSDVVKRAEKEGVIALPDELVIKGRSGELIITRYFKNLEWQFILMAYANRQCSYRRATNYAMQLCEPVLADFVYI